MKQNIFRLQFVVLFKIIYQSIKQNFDCHLSRLGQKSSSQSQRLPKIFKSKNFYMWQNKSNNKFAIIIFYSSLKNVKM
ncbi:hypothetical protein BpHYR1_003170 [Brachionus plicatilis]|uniref:Uncharacterized protein n=1 Tax=Brachionus plicatilis TaxID=10195 RepID=A0A3M7QYG6_BRAPC|nr:hypothetical protein BpHYR1_003170 [Brachionus plicatilis]